MGYLDSSDRALHTGDFYHAAGGIGSPGACSLKKRRGLLSNRRDVQCLTAHFALSGYPLFEFALEMCLGGEHQKPSGLTGHIAQLRPHLCNHFCVIRLIKNRRARDKSIRPRSRNLCNISGRHTTVNLQTDIKP
jgi:hypothetical protein